MPRFSNKRRVQPYRAEMFDLVADVERYPEFVPLCQSLKVRQRTPKPNGTEIVVADMTVAFNLVKRNLHQRSDARPSQFEDRRSSYLAGRSAVSKIAGRSSRRAKRLRRRLLHRLRFKSRMLAAADGLDVRCGVRAVFGGVRETPVFNLREGGGCVVLNILHRHCGRSEAIHDAATRAGLLRRCAPRDDVAVFQIQISNSQTGIRVRHLAARIAPELLYKSRPSEYRAQGKPVPAAPAASCAK